MEEVKYPLVPLPPVEGDAVEPTKVAEADRVNSALRRERAGLCQNFTHTEHAGSSFRDYYTQLHETLLAQGQTGKVGVGGESRKFQVVSSFFEMMLELRQRKREFVVVFRTFGTDLEVCMCVQATTKQNPRKWPSLTLCPCVSAACVAGCGPSRVQCFL